MPIPVTAVPAVASGANAADEPATPRADVVAIHRPGEDPVRRRVEALDELLALVVEVADDRRPPVGLDGAPEAFVEVGLAAVRRHGQLARERQAVQAESLDELDLEVVPGDRHRARGGRRGDRHHVVHGLRPRERHLERDHPAERAADDEREPLDPERVEQPPLRARLVPRRDRRERRRRTVGRSPGRATPARSCRSGRRAGSRTGRRTGRCRARGPDR